MQACIDPEYIDRDALNKRLSFLSKRMNSNFNTFTVLSEINKFPAANVRENVIRTQADRIRAMSDEELAEAIHDCCPPHITQGWCARHPCSDCWLDWLKSPVEVDDGN